MGLILIGVAFGSFVNAYVWRTHQQLGNKKKSQKKHLSILNGRSMCVRCQHALAWFDLIPVISWLLLRGRCRYCQKPISWQYPVIELAMGTFVALSYSYWPYNLESIQDHAVFFVWLVLLVFGLALSLYDLKWMLLPNSIMYPFIGVSLIFAVLLAAVQNNGAIVSSAVLGGLGFGGLFYLLYQLSKGRWIGGGDVRLGFALGFILGWQKSIVGLILAAYLGMAIIIILLLLGRYRKSMKLPFGPLLLAGTYTALLWGQQAIDWYLKLSGF